MSDRGSETQVDRLYRRLTRGVILLGIAGAFFVLSMLFNLAQGGGLRPIDIAVPAWAALFLAYLRRWLGVRHDRRK